MGNVKGIFSEFLLYCKFQKNLSPKSLKAYSIDIAQFSDFLSNHDYIHNVEDINKSILLEYLQVLSSKFRIKTIKRKFACLKSIFNYLEFENKIQINPFRQIKFRLKEPFQLPKSITLNEIQKILQTAYNLLNEVRFKNSYQYAAIIRDIAILEILFATGLRVSELCNVKRSDINFEEMYIKVNGKGSKERIIFIGNKEVKEAISKYYCIFEDKIKEAGYFFINRLNSRLSEQSVRFMINKYTHLSMLEKHITPHVFRHSFATLLLEEGVDIKCIQHFLGHSSITTTQIYTHVKKEMQKEILMNKHPRKNIDIIKFE